MKGQIIKIVSDSHIVLCDDKKYDCKCRGRFRKENLLPLVGDYVLFDPSLNVIEEVLPRKNEFHRPKVANIDQAILVTSLKTPDFSSNLLDKLLVLMELHQVDPVICITKSDLISHEKLREVKEVLSYYEDLGYTVLFNTELAKIKKLLHGKTTVFTGQTGAGKSTLLNHLHEGLHLEVGEVSLALGRGRHTTRVVELFPYYDGKILDTPGFSALDFHEYSREEIRDGFIEFQKFPCEFQDCMHQKEAECCVKEAVSSNNIMKSRYENYLKLIERK